MCWTLNQALGRKILMRPGPCPQGAHCFAILHLFPISHTLLSKIETGLCFPISWVSSQNLVWLIWLRHSVRQKIWTRSQFGPFILVLRENLFVFYSLSMDLFNTRPMYISSKWVEVCSPLSVALMMLYCNYQFTCLSHLSLLSLWTGTVRVHSYTPCT